MATDSVMNLFMDPYQLEQQRQAGINQRASQFAQLDPMAQAQYGIYRGASNLGTGIGGLLGAEDPQMKLMAARKQIMQQVDQMNPESLAQAAQALNQAGDVQGATVLLNAARTRAKELQAEQLTQSQIAKNTRTAGSTTVSERNREMIANAEIKLSKGENLSPEEAARVRWLIGQENKPKVFRDADTGEITTIEPIDLVTAAPNLAALVGKTAKEGTTGVAGTATTTPATKISPALRKETATVDEQMTALDTSINKVTSLTPKINNLDLGLYQNIERGVSGYLGKPTKDTVEFKQLKRTVLEQANNLLLLAKGTQTEGDAQRAKDQIADEDTWKNRDLLTAAFDDLKTTLSNTKKALESKRTTLTSSGIPAVPGFGAEDIAPKKNPLSGANPQLQPSEAPRATHRFNPSTGRVEAL